MLLTIVASPKSISQRLSFLKSKFSKPQFNIIKGLAVGLVSLETISVSRISNTVSFLPSQSAVSKALLSKVWSAAMIMTALSQHLASKTKYSGRLVLDDTLGKKYTKTAEYSYYLHDHNEKRSYWSFNLNLCQYIDESQFFFTGFTTYSDAKTKLETGLNMVQQARANGIKFSNVITDSWFFDNNLINGIVSIDGVHWVGGVKANFVIRVNNRWTQLKYFKKTIKPNQLKLVKNRLGEKYYIYEDIYTFKAIDRNIKVVFSRKKRNKGDFKILGTTNLKFSAVDVLNEYSYRWNIEPSIEDMKERLGLKDYQGNTTHGFDKYIAIVLLTYSILTTGILKRNKYTLGDFIKDIWRELFQSVVRRFARFIALNPQLVAKDVDIIHFFFLT